MGKKCKEWLCIHATWCKSFARKKHAGKMDFLCLFILFYGLECFGPVRTNSLASSTLLRHISAAFNIFINIFGNDDFS